MEEANEINLYQPDETVKLDVRVEHKTVWLTQAQMAELFGTKRPAITKHLANIYKSGELEEKSTCSILEHIGEARARSYETKYYNLDVFLSVGYRINSINATKFRQWANKVGKLIHDTLYEQLPDTSYTLEEVETFSEKLYRYIYYRYPQVAA